MMGNLIIEVSPEPGPNFTIGRQQWGVAWPVFFNGYGILFALLFLYSLKNIAALLGTVRKKNFQRRKLFAVVNAVLAYYTGVTSLTLLMDPYNSGEHFNVIPFRGIIFMLGGMRLPCLTASFSLITMSLLEVTKLQLYSPRLQNYKCIAGMTGSHFLLVFTVDLVLLFFRNVTAMLLLCQVGMVIISLTISIASCYAGYRVIAYLNLNKGVLNNSGISYVPSSGNSGSKVDVANQTHVTKDSEYITTLPVGQVKKNLLQARESFKDRSVRKIARITLITATFGILYGVATVYSLISVFQSSNSMPDVWAWYTFQVCLKFVEVGITGSMLYIVRRGEILKMLRKCWQ